MTRGHIKWEPFVGSFFMRPRVIRIPPEPTGQLYLHQHAFELVFLVAVRDDDQLIAWQDLGIR